MKICSVIDKDGHRFAFRFSQILVIEVEREHALILIHLLGEDVKNIFVTAEEGTRIIGMWQGVNE